MAVHYYSHRHMHPAVYEDSRDLAISRIVQMVWVIFAVIEAVLLLRFGLRLLGASSAAPFVAFIYNLSAFFLIPFRMILPVSAAGRGILEWGTLLALIIYWLTALLVAELVEMARPAARIAD